MKKLFAIAAVVIGCTPTPPAPAPKPPPAPNTGKAGGSAPRPPVVVTIVIDQLAAWIAEERWPWLALVNRGLALIYLSHSPLH